MENLQKAEVQKEKKAEGRIQVTVLSEARLEVFLQLVVRFLHLIILGDRIRIIDNWVNDMLHQLYHQVHLNYGAKMINPGSKKDLTNWKDNAKVENHKAAEKGFWNYSRWGWNVM